MKETVRRLLFIHLAVLALAALGSAFLWGWAGSVAALVGALAFSVPTVAYGGLVVRASEGDQARFVGKFMKAELLKWVSAGALLTLAFLSKLLSPQPLLAGFFLSVLVQVFFPIFVPKASQS